MWFLEVCRSCCCGRSRSWEVCWFEGDKYVGFLLLEGVGIVVLDVYSASIRSWFVSLSFRSRDEGIVSSLPYPFFVLISCISINMLHEINYEPANVLRA